MMGMDSEMMSGTNGSSIMLFGWLIYLEIVIILALGIAALWKYLQK